MSEDALSLSDEFDRLLESKRKKTPYELEVERAWPNLPPHVLKSMTAEQFMWLSVNEKKALIETGSERGGGVDYWHECGG